MIDKLRLNVIRQGNKFDGNVGWLIHHDINLLPLLSIIFNKPIHTYFGYINLLKTFYIAGAAFPVFNGMHMLLILRKF